MGKTPAIGKYCGTLVCVSWVLHSKLIEALCPWISKTSVSVCVWRGRGGVGHWSLRALHITCNLQLGYPLSLSLFWQMSCLQEFHCSKTKLAEDTWPTGISIYIWTCWKQESRKSFCHGLDLHRILNVYAYMNMYVFLLLFFANKFRRKACTIFSTCNLWLPPQLPVTWFLTSLFRVLHDFLIAKSSSCFQFLISPGPWQAPPDLLRTPVLQALPLTSCVSVLWSQMLVLSLSSTNTVLIVPHL